VILDFRVRLFPVLSVEAEHHAPIRALIEQGIVLQSLLCVLKRVDLDDDPTIVSEPTGSLVEHFKRL
jgi:hypothetical protein